MPLSAAERSVQARRRSPVDTPPVRLHDVFPHARPARWVRVASRTLDALSRRGPLHQPLDAEGLMAEASARTGLQEWGEGFRRDALEQLVRSARTDARLNGVGRLALSGAVRRALCNWLQLVEQSSRHPDALAQPVQRPVVIAGMPRTGSTFLQQLLAAHPDVRHLPMWLAASPLPAPTAEQWRAGGDRARRWAARKNAATIQWLLPAMRDIHPYAVDLPVECTHLMSPTFFSNQWAAWPLHSFLEWVEQQPPPSYAAYRAQLQLLQAAIPGKGWVLKSPGHFIEMATLHQTVPEALIVHLHRDPAVVMPSLNSMMATHHLLFTWEPDFQRSADSYLRTMSRAADRVVELRARAEADRFVDVGYRELRSDPVGVAGRIFERAGLRWDDAVRQALRRQLSAGQRSGSGHDYPLEQFGQTPDGIREIFARYIGAFGVEAEA